ncbi:MULTISPECIES: MarR family transcriptional regulator [unclassified Streptomyces]|uniref:MarR family transcriptional regulator n=1 Tax=unclassified Streptomyces TaxID=2593676 RepID=UPI000F6BE711|nr:MULTISPECIES: helix-turn-helix domain-containing protein [unclassified Streptomyces]AZM60455.1 ArsR family transcriptional regulator [Streptomyces sp. WAC 01438]RSM86780.1 ArsR family transcriptional regulator [Streptomyces sp. WAC 01420]
MLRIHFTDADLARTRIAPAPDPLFEITASLHRLQTRTGRWAYAGWYRTARERMREQRLERVVRSVLLPVYPRAAYFPDFLNPVDAVDGLDAGFESILATPAERVREELGILDRTVGAPAWSGRLAEYGMRRQFVGVLRAYHEAVIVPHAEHVQARIEAERAARGRLLLDGGVEGMLAGLGPMLRWRPPVLEVSYPRQAEDRDLHLNGRGITLVPSYFNWGEPVAYADPGLPPVLWYSLLHEPEARRPSADDPGRSLTNLLGRARAVALHTASGGATTGEIARAAGVSASAASRHATALRDAGLVTTVRNGRTVLHTLTPTGASLLRAARRRTNEDAAGTPA